MTEFSDPAAVNESMATFHREHAQFTGSMRDALGLNEAQHKAMASIEPTLWLPWAVSVLGGQEKTAYVEVTDPLITEISDAARQLLCGELVLPDGTFADFNRGGLAGRVRALYEGGGPAALAKLGQASAASARFALGLAEVVGFDSTPWRQHVPRHPQAIVVPDKLGKPQVFFSMSPATYPVDGLVRSVVTYGPGLSGAPLAAPMAGRIKEYHYVSGGMGASFQNGLIAGELQAASRGIEAYRRMGRLPLLLRPGVRSEDVRVPEAYFYNNGIAAAVGPIATRTVAQGKPVDVVLMAGVHSAGAEECIAGVHGAKLLLRPGGLLVVKLPRTSLGNDGGLDVVAPVASDAFGGPVAAGECGTLGENSNPANLTKRAADFVIYRK